MSVIIVLGGPVDEDGRPRAHLALRLEAALAAGQAFEAAGKPHKYLLTGGAVKSYGSAGNKGCVRQLCHWSSKKSQPQPHRARANSKTRVTLGSTNCHSLQGW